MTNKPLLIAHAYVHSFPFPFVFLSAVFLQLKPMGDTAQHMQLVRDFSAVAKERQKAQTFVSNTVWECSHGHRCEHGVYVWYSLSKTLLA